VSALFGPDGRLVDPDALRSVQFGQVRRRPRVVVDRAADTVTEETFREDTGEPAGYRTRHGSGRVDVTVNAPAAVLESGV
jgi:hypothetical protein